MRGRTMVPHFFSLFVIFFTTVWGEKISDYCPGSRCGNIMIEYPFYLRDDVSSASNRSGICGYEGFGISCDQTTKTAFFTLPSDIYVVLNIDYAMSRLSLVDTEIHLETCPKPRHNVSLGANSSLKLNPQNINFTFFIDCLRPPSYQNTHPAFHASHNLKAISCMGNSSSHKQSYAIPSASADRIDWRAADCDRAVVVPLMGVPVTGQGVFPTEVKGGYVLDWNPTIPCARCGVSGGRCGYYNGSSKPQFVCYCEGGTKDRECRGMNGLRVCGN